MKRILTGMGNSSDADWVNIKELENKRLKMVESSRVIFFELFKSKKVWIVCRVNLLNYFRRLFNYITMPKSSKNEFELKIKKFAANLSKAAFLAQGNAKALLSSGRSFKILFSANYGNEKTIKRAFSLSRHKIKFAPFTPENIRESDLVIPLLIQDVRLLQKSRDLLANNPIKIPTEEVVDLCDNKYLFNKTLVEKGFQDFVPKIGTNLPLPFMLKKKVTWAGDDCYLISDPEKKAKYDGFINSDDYFCQEIIGGINEYATHILFSDGKIVETLTVEYTFYDEIPINGKSGFAYTRIVKCEHLKTFASILKAIGYEGLCCFDYKIANGKPKIFEINPRFGGSLGNYFFTFLDNLEPAA